MELGVTVVRVMVPSKGGMRVVKVSEVTFGAESLTAKDTEYVPVGEDPKSRREKFTSPVETEELHMPDMIISQGRLNVAPYKERRKKLISELSHSRSLEFRGETTETSSTHTVEPAPAGIPFFKMRKEGARVLGAKKVLRNNWGSEVVGRRMVPPGAEFKGGVNTANTRNVNSSVEVARTMPRLRTTSCVVSLG
jgi:hypothetical protein